MPHDGSHPGKQYFTPYSDEDRIKVQTEYEMIYLGNHRVAFNPIIPVDAMYIPEPFAKTITLTSADLLFGEPINIVHSAEDQEGKDFLESFNDANPLFQRNLWDASVTQSFTGESIVELVLEEGAVAPSPLFHDPRHWIPTIDEMGNITAHTLCFIVRQGNAEYLWKRIHTIGFIENQLFALQPSVSSKAQSRFVSEARIIRQVPMSTIGMDISEGPVATGVDEFLVHQVKNMSLPSSVHGMSDYMGMRELMSALNSLTSSAFAVIEKHSDPIMEVPEETVDEQNEAEFAKAWNSGDAKAIEVNPEEKGTTRYITWDAKLEPLFELRRNVLRSLASSSEIAPGLIGLEDEPLPESGKALRLRFSRTLRKSQRKQLHWKEAIIWILKTSQLMMGTTDLSSYSVVFSDGLPEDEGSLVQMLSAEKELGIKSEETIIREGLSEQGYTQDMIESELERIATEKASRRGAEVGVPSLFERSVDVAEDGTTT